MSKKTNPPIKRINSLYPVSVSIWQRDTEKGAFFSVTFERTYRDEKGDYRTTNRFQRNDLLLLSKCADQAHTQVVTLEAADRMRRKASEEQEVPTETPATPRVDPEDLRY